MSVKTVLVLTEGSEPPEKAVVLSADVAGVKYAE